MLGQATAGAYGAIDGYTRGGVMGGLETGLGVMGMIQAIAPKFGPWGMAIAGAAGLVSAFTHQDNKAAMPDKYDSSNYGQGLANLIGQAGVNGTTYYQSADTKNITGGKTGLAYIEAQLAKGKPSWMNQDEYDRYVATFGKSAGGSGTVQHGHDIGQEWITGAAGAQANAQSYQTINQMMNDFLQKSGSQGTTLAPIMSVNSFGGRGRINPYNVPGMNASELDALKANTFSTLPGAKGPYSTPGVNDGTSSSKPLYVSQVATQPIQLTSNLVVDGKVLAQIVNAVNASTANQQGKLAA
jgi:hypothetical protein